MAKSITVFRDVSTPLPTGAYEVVLSFKELREQIIRGRGWRHFFRYTEANLVTDRVERLSKPFSTAVLMRLMSRGRCFFRDADGARARITYAALARSFARLVRDFTRKRSVIRRVREEIRSLSAASASADVPTVDVKGRVVYLRTDLIFGTKSGGSVGHIAGVLNNLHELGHYPILLTSDVIPTVRPNIEAHVVAPSGSFRDFQELPRLYYNFTFPKSVRAILAGVPTAFIYQRYSVNNYSGLKIATARRIPFVLEYNGSELWIHRNWGRAFPQRYLELAEQIETLNLTAAHVIVVVSEALRAELIERGIREEKILVNPNGVCCETYSPSVDGNVIRCRYDLNGKRVLGFIGTFGKWHGAEVLAEAFGRLISKHPALRENTRLLLIGDGVTMPQVVANLARHGVVNSTTMTGIIPQAQGPEHLAACDVLVSPHVPNSDGSQFFGSPTKLFEYMAMGKGIVASNLGQIGEILDHGRTAWMVRAGDVDDLTAGMKQLLDAPDLCARLGSAAREVVVNQYTWKKHVQRILDKLYTI